jgi:hypothetical protein
MMKAIGLEGIQMKSTDTIDTISTMPPRAEGGCLPSREREQRHSRAPVLWR